MKRGICFLLVYLITITFIHAQETNKKVFDKKSETEILVGYCDINGLKDGEYGYHFREEYTYYIPDANTVTALKEHIDDLEITIILGTWCGDSKEQVPRFYNVLDELKYDTKKIKLICVDRDKKADKVEISSYNVELVPTFFFYRNGEELGRIIETPEENLEADMLKIIKNKEKIADR